MTDQAIPEDRVGLDADARALLERVRGGELTEERVRLAAWLGDEVARAALGANAPVQPVETNPMRALAGAPFTTESFRSEMAWRAFFAAHHEASDEWDEHLSEVGGRIGMFWSSARKVEAELVAGWPIVDSFVVTLPALGDAVWFVGEARVWTAIRRELVAWALGESDPVRDRAQALG